MFIFMHMFLKQHRFCLLSDSEAVNVIECDVSYTVIMSFLCDDLYLRQVSETKVI